LQEDLVSDDNEIAPPQLEAHTPETSIPEPEACEAAESIEIHHQKSEVASTVLDNHKSPLSPRDALGEFLRRSGEERLCIFREIWGKNASLHTNEDESIDCKRCPTLDKPVGFSEMLYNKATTKPDLDSDLTDLGTNEFPRKRQKRQSSNIPTRVSPISQRTTRMRSRRGVK
jgi:hypothetical protein